MTRLSWLLGGASAVVLAACSVYGNNLVGTGGAGGTGGTSSTSSTSGTGGGAGGPSTLTSSSTTSPTSTASSTSSSGSSTTSSSSSTTSTSSSSTTSSSSSSSSTTSSSTSSSSTSSSSTSSSSTSSSTSSGGPACNDHAKNGAETDVDCGGGTCPACGSGKHCGINNDCQNANCVGGTCDDVLLISQVQSRGASGGSDEFVELYNPTSGPVTFDTSWVLKARSATGGVATCANNGLGQRFAGAGQVIPPHGHILYANSSVPGYSGATPSDMTYLIGVPDAASVVLLHGNTIVDALCFYYDQPTLDALTTCPAAYLCEGMPALNPHNNLSSSNANKSLERLPGGAMGNAVDTNDNAVDFATATPSDPHDLTSPPAP